MNKDMRHYVEQEKDMISKVISNFNKNSESLNDLKESFKSIVIYATGSSMNAALSAKVFLSKILDMNVELKEPSFAQYYDLYLDDNILYIAISQGGQSSSIIRLVEHLQKENKKVYVLTNEVKSKLGSISENVLNLGMGKEEMPFVTVGQSSTIVYLWLIGLSLSKKLGIIDDKTTEYYHLEILKVVKLIPQCIKEVDDWYVDHKDVILEADRFNFISYGATLGVVKEFETKFTETVRVPSSGYEMEEFMHGPYIGINEDDVTFFIEPKGQLQERQSTLYTFLNNHIKETYRITLYEGISSADLVLLCNYKEKILEDFSSLLFNVPVHLMSWSISQNKKIDLTQSSYPDFDILLKSKI